MASRFLAPKDRFKSDIWYHANRFKVQMRGSTVEPWIRKPPAQPIGGIAELACICKGTLRQIKITIINLERVEGYVVVRSPHESEEMLIPVWDVDSMLCRNQYPAWRVKQSCGVTHLPELRESS